MAHPFIQFPTLAEFIERVKSKYEVTEATSAVEATGPRGKVRFRYLRRGDGAPVILPDIADNDRLTPGMLSNLCRRLQIPPKEFGYTLGFIEDPFDPSNYPETEN